MADTCLSSEPKKGFKRSGIKAFTEAKVTPVILVCVYNQNSTVITHDTLYSVFARYGKILRILIFEKMKVWKAFLEFDNLDSAFEAKKDMNDFLLFNDGTRMNVYYSNLDTIQFQNNNSGGKDYTIEEYDPNEFNEDQDIDMNIEAYYQDQDELDQHLNPEIYDEYYQDEEELIATTQSYQYPQETQAQTMKTVNNNAVLFDDKDDDILKMVNDHQKNLITKAKSKEPQSICEEDKFDADKDEDIFSQYFTTPFQTKLPTSSNKPNRLKQKTLSVKSKAFGVQPPVWQQQPNLEQPQLNNSGDSTPPGLMAYSDSSSLSAFSGRKNHKMIGYSSSLTQIPRVPMPFTPNKVTSSKFANTVENSPLRPGLIPKSLPHVHSMNSIPTSYGPPLHQILKTQPEEAGKMRQYTATPKGNSRSSFDPRNGSQTEVQMPEDLGESTSPKFSNLSYESLVEMIEQDILQNWSSLIKSANLSSLHASLFKDGALGGLTQDRIGTGEIGNLSNMSLSKLSQLHNELSVLLGKAENNKKSQVLYVQGLEDSDIQMNMIYNIFSNFGNIVKIIFIKAKGSALIEFETAEYSAIAKDYLNNLVFMGNPLRIFYSNYSIMNLKAKDSTEETFIGTAKTSRFKKNKNISMNPPSPILHVSNLTKEICKDEKLRNYFSPYGKVGGIRFMFVENKNMCLLKMPSIEESLIAMAHLHDTELGGRRIQISFTRSKL